GDRYHRRAQGVRGGSPGDTGRSELRHLVLQPPPLQQRLSVLRDGLRLRVGVDLLLPGREFDVLECPLVAQLGALRRRSENVTRYVQRPLLYVLAALGALLFMGPFFFAISSSLKTAAEIHMFPPLLLPAEPMFSNYTRIFQLDGVQFARWYLN